MSLFLSLPAIALAVWFDLRPKIKAKQKTESWVTGIMLGAALSVLVLVEFKVQPPSLWQPLTDLAEQLFGN